MSFSRITVVGLGYVGLPAAAVFADSGLEVVGVDIDEAKVKMLNRGEVYLSEPGLGEIVRRAVEKGLFRATTSLEEGVRDSDAVVIAVPTPVQGLRADLSYLENVLSRLSELLRRGMLVVIESTIPPGTTRGFAEPILSRSGLRVEEDYYLAHVPERIAPGKAIYELRNEPRVVGGYGPRSTEKALELYGRVNRRLQATDSTTAEFVKIIENTFRDLNIAYANLLALVAERLGIDVYEAIALANTHPRVNIHMPGAGVGGPCLTKDPYMLVGTGLGVPGIGIVSDARLINQYMPRHVAMLTLRALRENNIDPGEAVVTVLGAAYKGGVDDTRESPARYVVEELIGRVGELRLHDPYVEEGFGARYYRSLPEAVKGSDAVVVVTEHPEFRRINLGELYGLMRSHIIVDGRRIFDPREASRSGFRYYGVGYGKNAAGRW